MAATRLIALHVNKGKTVAQCLADRTDYSQNAAKTNDGEFISSYECDPKTADEEFMLSKRQYQHITGRQQKNNIIAYQMPFNSPWLRLFSQTIALISAMLDCRYATTSLI